MNKQIGDEENILSSVEQLLQDTEHRPFPLPESEWLMRQSWSKLLFAHWPLKPHVLREHVPANFELDTYDQWAWLGVVPFAMRHVCPKNGFEVPMMSNFLELNLRTYVVKDGIPGVYFFSLDCSNPIAVLLARKFYHLPYFFAQMKMDKKDKTHVYHSRRLDGGIEFQASYRPTGKVFTSSKGSLEEFLTERYCLYTTDAKGTPYRGVIHHSKWPLQPAEASVQAEPLVHSQLRMKLPKQAPILHYSKDIKTLEWPLQRLT